jgi:thiamine biosynthesis lipoprotein
MEFDEFSAMNTTIQVAAEGNHGDIQDGFSQVRRFIAASEERFSRFRETSELSQLNRSAGTWFRVSPSMYSLVHEAYQLYWLTEGLFDPSILKALIEAGYDRSLDEIKINPNHSPQDTSEWIGTRFGETRFDAHPQAIRLPAGVQIDLGGIAKGWIAARAVELLSHTTDACAVSAGGDMVFKGIPAGQTEWQVDLEDPQNEDHVLAILNIEDGALATSSVTRRRWVQGEQTNHHIIDPRTGKPAQSVWLSVSVATENPTTAEAFAKALLIAGPERGPQLAAKVPDLKFIAVQTDGSLWGTHESKELIYVPEAIQ